MIILILASSLRVPETELTVYLGDCIHPGPPIKLRPGDEEDVLHLLTKALKE